MSTNGLAVVSLNRTLGLPAVPTDMFVGRQRNNAYFHSGHIAKIRYYPLAAADAQLQLMTP